MQERTPWSVFQDGTDTHTSDKGGLLWPQPRPPPQHPMGSRPSTPPYNGCNQPNRGRRAQGPVARLETGGQTTGGMGGWHREGGGEGRLWPLLPTGITQSSDPGCDNTGEGVKGVSSWPRRAWQQVQICPGYRYREGGQGSEWRRPHRSTTAPRQFPGVEQDSDTGPRPGARVGFPASGFALL